MNLHAYLRTYSDPSYSSIQMNDYSFGYWNIFFKHIVPKWFDDTLICRIRICTCRIQVLTRIGVNLNRYVFDTYLSSVSFKMNLKLVYWISQRKRLYRETSFCIHSINFMTAFGNHYILRVYRRIPTDILSWILKMKWIRQYLVIRMSCRGSHRENTLKSQYVSHSTWRSCHISVKISFISRLASHYVSITYYSMYFVTWKTFCSFTDEKYALL